MNHLAGESSPYLLQHAHNPVNWYPWGEAALSKAKTENKLIVISIGYSACHWCHVMERESFENKEVAEVMNKFFVCVKVDREERPDIDQIYMSAVQLMNGNGGWPLNCITLPDQRPIYGGTYFRKDDWIKLLLQLANHYQQNPEQTIDYASRLTQGIRQMELIPSREQEKKYSIKDLQDIFDPWLSLFDFTEGGHNRAPKFPLPSNFQFLLRYAHFMNDDKAHVITRLTLEKMALGGIYDQVGGGFCRYAVDELWKVPHFEKMLYDNGQLISLYAEAYRKYKDPLYKQIVYQTIAFAEGELSSPEHGFYSALDADSEGVEGKFYVWEYEELEHLLGADTDLFCSYYNITEDANWEEGNILHASMRAEEFAAFKGVDLQMFEDMLNRCRKILMTQREQRVKPGLDDKILCSWNAIMLKGLCDAYKAFTDEHFRELAVRNASFVISKMLREDGRVFRNYKDHKLSIGGFLDDHALLADALIHLYEITGNEVYLHKSRLIVNYVIAHFYDHESGMFWYTSSEDEKLIARKQETSDNVIPSSNSVMANVLFRLGNLVENEDYKRMALQQLHNVASKIKNYGSAYSNWAILLIQQVFPFYELAVSGPDAEQFVQYTELKFHPNKVISYSPVASDLPLLKDRFVPTQTLIYQCRNNTCGLPLRDPDLLSF